MARVSGRYERSTVGGEDVAAFVPRSLPPVDPPLDIGGSLRGLLEDAEGAVARLEVAGAMVPSLSWLIYSFVRKEAVVSSQIEGTQASLIDLLTYEATGAVGAAREADVEEVCNYVDALSYARDQLHSKKGLPLSVRLLNETHRLLMTGARGGDKQPGEIRRSQNWIGGTRPGDAVFVPPPHHLLGDLLGDMERYIHSDDGLPPIIRAGLVHVQFETIHPYLDGNGRVGRLLVALLLEHWGVLSQPLLYLSLFFKRHQTEYYRRLGSTRTDGNFEGWLDFFLEGVAVIADEAVAAVKALFDLVATDRARVLASGSTSITAARLFEQLPGHPVVTIGGVTTLLDTTKPTASKAVSALVDAGVLVEITGQRRDRIYSYAAYLDELGRGTELEITTR
jgi:Fic family protein